ncbi:DUF2268 domain-containing protein (plasmid) [Paracoccus sp. TK19116]|uniref:DUF2268 domain-containing protein n=1 Tax=Paracoccus albicereus TaxID=2922394 RepID=A0ABT1MP28_9RHOB|nr:DUF2268 domain-containing putative Zn-dependent protease [Paracoccus albicereus]MCQ0969484.1 DUF2268 domain-containing protein [Paracoccus albicereus]
MSVWHLHILNARNDLTRVLPDLRATVREAVERAAEHADLPRFDVVIHTRQGSERDVLPSISGPGLIDLAVDPQRFDRKAMIRETVRALHRVIRRAGPGSGNSLGDALVGEGLAGHFVLQVLGGRPESIETMTPAEGVARRAMAEWSRLSFDPGEWFLGRGKLRKGTGQALGFKLVETHLANAPGETAISLAAARSDSFREVMRAMAKADAEEPAEPTDPEDGKKLD